MPVERDCGVAQRMLTDTTPGWRQLPAAYHTPTGLVLLDHTIVSHSLLIFPIAKLIPHNPRFRRENLRPCAFF
jgi:hypothetical protein